MEADIFSLCSMILCVCFACKKKKVIRNLKTKYWTHDHRIQFILILWLNIVEIKLLADYSEEFTTSVEFTCSWGGSDRVCHKLMAPATLLSPNLWPVAEFTWNYNSLLLTVTVLLVSPCEELQTNNLICFLFFWQENLISLLNKQTNK